MFADEILTASPFLQMADIAAQVRHDIDDILLQGDSSDTLITDIQIWYLLVFWVILEVT